MFDTVREEVAFANWLTGFVDAEGSFTINQNKKKDVSSSDCGILSVEFSIQLREDDGDLLKRIQDYFGCGLVGGNSRAKARRDGAWNARDECTYKCTKVDDLVSKIIPHFEAYPLRTRKALDFEVWKQAVFLQRDSQRIRGRHKPIRFFPECVKIRDKIVSLRETLISGRRSLTPDYPECLIDEGFGHWFSGLVDGEGCFGIYAYETEKKKKSRRGCLSFVFSVGLCEADRKALEVSRDFLGTKSLRMQTRKGNKKNMVRMESKNLDDILRLILPHFSVYPLRSKKSGDFKLWAKAVLLQEKCFGIRGTKHTPISNLPESKQRLCDRIRNQISLLSQELQKDRNPSLRRSKKSWSA